MTQNDAVEFLKKQRVETLLSSPPKGEDVAKRAILVSENELSALMSPDFKGGVAIGAESVTLSRYRETNIAKLTAAQGVAIGTVSFNWPRERRDQLCVNTRPRSEYHDNCVVQWLLANVAEDIVSPRCLNRPPTGKALGVNRGFCTSLCCCTRLYSFFRPLNTATTPSSEPLSASKY
jgi:hypothetical protein